MKKQEHIIIFEDNEISLFVTKGMLASLEKQYSINYFSNADDTLAFIQNIPVSSAEPVSLFLNIGVALNDDGFVDLVKKALLPFSSRLFLLSSLLVSGEKRLQFEKLGFVSCIEKPLSEQKFIQALSQAQSPSQGCI